MEIYIRSAGLRRDQEYCWCIFDLKEKVLKRNEPPTHREKTKERGLFLERDPALSTATLIASRLPTKRIDAQGRSIRNDFVLLGNLKHSLDREVLLLVAAKGLLGSLVLEIDEIICVDEDISGLGWNVDSEKLEQLLTVPSSGPLAIQHDLFTDNQVVLLTTTQPTAPTLPPSKKTPSWILSLIVLETVSIIILSLVILFR